MRIEQHNTEAPTVLLCHANGVDAQETKSLCCAAAAGITKPVSATAEALIPHEKLREAAHPDATLNAQNRSLAQPFLGYTQLSGVVEFIPEGTEGRQLKPGGKP